MADRLLRIPEVAARLSLSPMSVRRLIQRGDLLALRLTPRTVRIAPAEVERVIAAGVTQGLADGDAA